MSDGNRPVRNFNRIVVGNKPLSNNVLMDVDEVETLLSKKIHSRNVRRDSVESALSSNDISKLRSYSRLFFDTSGIYMRLCRYMAYMYRYDWYLTPIIESTDVNGDDVRVGWFKVSRYLENSDLRHVFGDIALKVIRDGSYYGYKITNNDRMLLQELPVSYSRSRYELNGLPAVEFNVRYFDDTFSDSDYRQRVIGMWPNEIQAAYSAYKDGNLKRDFQSDDRGWVLLDPKRTVKFSLSGNDAPLFVAIIPKLMDLEDAQDIDKKRMMQQLSKILVQKIPLDKNGELLFDIPEVQQLHSNAVSMINGAVGVNVLTTFADVDMMDVSDNDGKSVSVDQLGKVERTVYNEAGTGQNLFNSEGNIALERSILNDEATMFPLLLQFDGFVRGLASQFDGSPVGVRYVAQMLGTTAYNYKELSKSYKELAQFGFSKLLPQVALGQTQSSVMMNSYFENEILGLNDFFVPPASSNTTPANDDGRPSLSDGDKSDKTLANENVKGM